MRLHRLAVAGVAALLGAAPAYAWIHPEHRTIAGEAIQGLDPEQRKALGTLWAAAREGHGARLCETPWAGAQGTKPGCIDLAAWPALAGDHSCSADDMLATVLESEWVLGVARISEELRLRLAKAKRRDQVRNALAGSDLKLENTDPGYSSRAGANNSHFLLARQTGDDVAIHLRRGTAAGAELNAVGIYAFEHVRALRLAAGFDAAAGTPGERGARARAILAAEAYALHFLEDAFAAGHVAGTWGKVADRKGTHDYYNEKGLDTQTWNGTRVVLLGDAWMRPEDLERTARAVRTSLAQLLAALEGPPSAGAPAAPLESCRAMELPAFQPDEAEIRDTAAVLFETPVPARVAGFGELPRFRSEIGPFVGAAASGAFAGSSGVAGYEDAGLSSSGTLSIGARIGVGLESLIGDSADGLVFLEGGIQMQSKQNITCTSCSSPSELAGYLPGIPGRTGLSFRYRMPFWLIPGDLLVATPILAFTAPDLLKRMAIRAANGGLVPIERGFATPVGRFQLVLGREIGATFFGYAGQTIDYFAPVPSSDGTVRLAPVSLKSIRLEVPVLEYRPFREFATRQTFTLLGQLGIGWDIPTQLTVHTASGPVERTPGNLVFGYFRIAFDWRRYF